MAKKSKTVNLAKYSKEDLIWIINRMSSFGQGWYLDEALRSLQYQKEMKRIDEADRIAKQSSAARQAYIDLISPYDGKPWGEIPLDILKKAQKEIDEADKLDQRWRKLMRMIGGQDG